MIWSVPRLKKYKCRFSGENCDDSAVPSVFAAWRSPPWPLADSQFYAHMRLPGAFAPICRPPFVLIRGIRSDCALLGTVPPPGEVRHQFILINRVSRYSQDTVSR